MIPLSIKICTSPKEQLTIKIHTQSSLKISRKALYYMEIILKIKQTHILNRLSDNQSEIKESPTLDPMLCQSLHLFKSNQESRSNHRNFTNRCKIQAVVRQIWVFNLSSHRANTKLGDLHQSHKKKSSLTSSISLLNQLDSNHSWNTMNHRCSRGLNINL